MGSLLSTCFPFYIPTYVERNYIHFLAGISKRMCSLQFHTVVPRFLAYLIYLSQYLVKSFPFVSCVSFIPSLLTSHWCTPSSTWWPHPFRHNRTTRLLMQRHLHLRSTVHTLCRSRSTGGQLLRVPIPVGTEGWALVHRDRTFLFLVDGVLIHLRDATGVPGAGVLRGDWNWGATGG